MTSSVASAITMGLGTKYYGSLSHHGRFYRCMSLTQDTIGN